MAEVIWAAVWVVVCVISFKLNRGLCGVLEGILRATINSLMILCVVFGTLCLLNIQRATYNSPSGEVKTFDVVSWEERLSGEITVRYLEGKHERVYSGYMPIKVTAGSEAKLIVTRYTYDWLDFATLRDRTDRCYEILPK